MNTAVLAMISALLASGVWVFLLGIYQTRKADPKMRAEMVRVVGETDSIAVETLKAALEVSQERVLQMVDEIKNRDRLLLDADKQILNHERRIASLQSQVVGMDQSIKAMANEIILLRQGGNSR